MDAIITDQLMTLLLISITFSIVLMALIQKIKMLPIINKDWHIWLLNLFLSFVLGIPFTTWFYKTNIENSIWVCLFAFIGAPALYTALKKQNLINYTPSSLEDMISLPVENEIKRD